MLLTVLAHGAVGNWDEILGVGIALLIALLLVTVWIYGRRFEPVVAPDQNEERPPVSGSRE